MTVQELIDGLSLVEDKSRLVINKYDAWFIPFRSLATIDLYTSDGGCNLYDTTKEAGCGEDKVVTIPCILIDTSDGIVRYRDETQQYFYTKD